jgi:hypothetical protein
MPKNGGFVSVNRNEAWKVISELIQQEKWVVPRIGDIYIPGPPEKILLKYLVLDNPINFSMTSYEGENLLADLTIPVFVLGWKKNENLHCRYLFYNLENLNLQKSRVIKLRPEEGYFPPLARPSDSPYGE